MNHTNSQNIVNRMLLCCFCNHENIEFFWHHR